MSKLRWDKDRDRLFEAGVDRGVLYAFDSGTDSYLGIAWNGITEVSENPNVSATPMYYDGRKVFDLVDPGNFSASLKAYTYPDEFLPFEGVEEDGVSGLFLSNQQPDTFGLSYRTLIGNPDKATDYAYKIHILYNVTAIPDSVTHQTISSNTDPIEFSWSLSAVPVDITNHRPTAHISIDTRHVSRTLISQLETLLYGGTTTAATLPDVSDILDLLT